MGKKRFKKKTFMTPKWVASDDQTKMITRKKDQSLECCFSSQSVSTSQTSDLITKTFLHFLKSPISFLTFNQFLTKYLNQNNPFKFVTNKGKGFSMDMVSRTSFMILVYHSLNYSV